MINHSDYLISAAVLAPFLSSRDVKSCSLATLEYIRTQGEGRSCPLLSDNPPNFVSWIFVLSIEIMPFPNDEQIMKTAGGLVEQLQAIFGKHPGFRPGKHLLPTLDLDFNIAQHTLKVNSSLEHSLPPPKPRNYPSLLNSKPKLQSSSDSRTRLESQISPTQIQTPILVE